MTTRPPLAVRKPAVQKYNSLCIYGKSGVGKTTLVGTMPGKGLVVDVPQVEGGDLVLADKSDRIDVFECDRWDLIDDVFWAMRAKEGGYDWVCIDSITGMQELAKRKVIAERDLKSDPHKITLPEWGQIGQLIGELVFRFKTLENWTIWTAQERTHGGNDDDDGPKQIGPDIIRSALAALYPSQLMVARLAMTPTGAHGELERTLRIEPHPMYIAKVRHLPGKDHATKPLVKRPNLNVLMRYLIGNGPAPRWADDGGGTGIYIEG